MGESRAQDTPPPVDFPLAFSLASASSFARFSLASSFACSSSCCLRCTCGNRAQRGRAATAECCGVISSAGTDVLAKPRLCIVWRSQLPRTAARPRRPCLRSAHRNARATQTAQHSTANARLWQDLRRHERVERVDVVFHVLSHPFLLLLLLLALAGEEVGELIV